MARQSFTNPPANLSTFLSAPVPAPPKKSGTPPPLAPGALAGLRNSEAASHREITHPKGEQPPPEPPPQVEQGHAGLDEARTARTEPARVQLMRVAGKHADAPARNEMAQKKRAKRRAMVEAKRVESVRMGNLMSKRNPTPEEREAQNKVREAAHVLYRTGAMATEDIAARCGVTDGAVRKWVLRYGWQRDPGVTPPPPRATLEKVREEREPQGHGGALKRSKDSGLPSGFTSDAATVQGVLDHKAAQSRGKQVMQQARETVLLATVSGAEIPTTAQVVSAIDNDVSLEDVCRWNGEGLEEPGKMDFAEPVDFDEFDDCTYFCPMLIATNSDGFSRDCIAEGLQGGTIEHEKSLSPAESRPASVTGSLVAGVLATQEAAEKAKWTERRESWRERTHGIMEKAMGAFEAVPDICFTDKDTTKALKDIQELSRKNLGLDTDQGKAGGGNLLVSILAAPVGIAVKIEQS